MINRILNAALLLQLLNWACAAEWRTINQSPGYCATYDICGHLPNSPNDHLSCADNRQAQPFDSPATYKKLQQVCPRLAAELGEDGSVCCTTQQLDILETQIQQASIFLVGCPACNANFKEFFCLMTCSPDQATFTNITAVQTIDSEGQEIDNAVAEMDVFLSPELGGKFYNSCADVIFAPVNQPAMNFVGGGAKHYQEFVDFLGLQKDRRSPPQGSPFQINFPFIDLLPDEMREMEGEMANCGEGALSCSCGDCPSGPKCEPPPLPPPPPPQGCPALGLASGKLTCLDFTFLAVFLAILACIPAFVRFERVQQIQEAQFNSGNEALLGQEEDGGSEICGQARQQPRLAAEESDFIEYPASEALLRQMFRGLGFICARKPLKTLSICCIVLLIAMAGILQLQVITEPEKLWVGPGSQAAADKAAYEEAFGSFYRISQLIISSNSSIVTDDNIRLLFDIQAKVDALTPSDNSSTTLRDICFKPFGESSSACAIQSVLEYWQNSLDSYQGTGTGPQLSPEYCFDHWNIACRAETGAPIDPKIVLGGFPRQGGNFSYSETATAFIVTYPLSPAESVKSEVLAWEQAFLKLAAGELTDMAARQDLKLSFSAESSVELELKRESGEDTSTVALSYLVMFIYVALSLGKIPRGATLSTALIHGKTLLALGGVLIVAACVAGALGICGWSGIGATMIIMEVIPFLALAIGVDNVFILTQAAETSVPEGTPPTVRAAAALASAGPSMLLAAMSETMAFAVGTLTSMPALRDFAACAAFAVAIDFVLQITAFPAMLALDAARIDSRRYDILPWIKAPSPWLEEDDDTQPTNSGSLEEDLLTPPSLPVKQEAPDSSWQLPPYHHTLRDSGGWGIGPGLRWYIRTIHTPLLQHPWIKGIVVGLFAGLTLWSCAMLPRLEKGLDQRVALPQDSYLQNYFSDITELLRVGPPMSFIVKNLNLNATTTQDDVNNICSVAGCNDDSLLNRISQASRSPWESYIASPASSWLDDFVSWVSPEIPQCCRVFPTNGSYCPPPDQYPCFDPSILDPDQLTHLCDECVSCFSPEDLPPGSKPTVQDFVEYLPDFLDAMPSAQCAKGGKGAYSNSIELDNEDSTGIKGLSEGRISASSFLSYYVPLSTQNDFISALKSSRDLAASASQALGLDIFAYSIFHIFFEQYLTLGGEALTMLGSAAVAIFILCLLATGSPWAAAIVLGVLSIMCVDLAGVMAATGIQANAVSLVNLAASVGIGVEFCVHIVHAFMEAPGTKEQRMAIALNEAGAAVLSGITATKLVGVAVLAAAKTAIFRVYFFKFYLALVVLGGLHGLVFLPVVLSTIGPEAFQHWRIR